MSSVAESRRETLSELECSERIERLKERMLGETRYVSIEQARIVTEAYREKPEEPRVLQRAHALARTLGEIEIRIDPDELIVGNRTVGVRAGVVSPEAGLNWVAEELDTLPTRPQDRFQVREEDARVFREEIYPFWKGATLEDAVEERIGSSIEAVREVVKINQTDHAQGHICPDTEKWLRLGPRGIRREAEQRLEQAAPAEQDFLRAVITVYGAAERFIERYADLARELRSETARDADEERNLRSIEETCRKIASEPPETFREALQSLWFLYVILQTESNASAFSPGRLDQILYPYLEQDLGEGRLDLPSALELLEAQFLKFNQIVYMRSEKSARYFAGFPINFTVAIGGQTADGHDATNLLTFLFLKAQEHIGLPQPNLSARLFDGSSREYLDECARVIGLGSGMPQIFSDESVIPSLERAGFPHEEAADYAVVGCVEISTHGNNLGWSDAGMFNMVKALELALNDGRCLLSGEQLGPHTGRLEDFGSFEELEEAYRAQLDFFFDRMIPLLDTVDRLHAELLPSPFLSGVVEDCITRATDVTAGGARYNYSGVQAIQVANVADSLAALRELVYGRGTVDPAELAEALRSNFDDTEPLRQTLLHKAPKYGNDVAWVDELGKRWLDYFADRLEEHRNARGGPYHMGMYTVSAHIPMGSHVGATPDGRHAKEPLADGGMSPVYGRDVSGPTAVLNSVGRVGSYRGSNGTLLNMKFLPQFFREPEDRAKFVGMLRGFCRLGIHHVQFNVVDRETLLEAKEHPEQYASLTVRVAGYTAYFTELAESLQDEIIARTFYGN